MNRRDLLKFLLTAPIAATLDVEKLLWIPGEKTIFLPPIHRLTESQIVALEIERMMPKVRYLFEKDDTFYKMIVNGCSEVISDKQIRIPLIIKPGH